MIASAPTRPKPPSGGWLLAPGDILGTYRIIAPLATGGMAEVYQAEHLLFSERLAAIKVLQAEKEHLRDYKQRFMEEIVLLNTLKHPNVVRLFDASVTESGLAWMAMEFLRGETLAETLERRGRFAVMDAVRIVVDIAYGVAAAHAIKVIHRDLKPANVFLTTAHGVKVLDFGTAKIGDRAVAKSDRRTTDKYRVLGTRPYMSPEQLLGGTLDYRSDVFSLGIIAYELIAGVNPFIDADPGYSLEPDAIGFRIASEPPPGLTKLVPACPDAVGKLIERCLEKKPGMRFQSMAELSEAFERVLRGPLPTASPAKREVPLLAAAASDAMGARSLAPARETSATPPPVSAPVRNAVAVSCQSEASTGVPMPTAAKGRFGTEIIAKVDPARFGRFGTELLPHVRPDRLPRPAVAELTAARPVVAAPRDAGQAPARSRRVSITVALGGAAILLAGVFALRGRQVPSPSAATPAVTAEPVAAVASADIHGEPARGTAEGLASSVDEAAAPDADAGASSAAGRAIVHPPASVASAARVRPAPPTGSAKSSGAPRATHAASAASPPSPPEPDRPRGPIFE